MGSGHMFQGTTQQYDSTIDTRKYWIIKYMRAALDEASQWNQILTGHNPLSLPRRNHGKTDR